MRDHQRRQNDAAFAVEGKLLRVRQDREEGIALVGKFGQLVEPGRQFIKAVDAASLDRGKLDRAIGDDTAEGLAGKLGAVARGDGIRPLRSTLLMKVDKNNATPGTPQSDGVPVCVPAPRNRRPARAPY